MVSFAARCCASIHMNITPDHVVSIHYTLRDEAGAIIDRSAEGEPLAYLHGHGNLIPGLERELTGKSAGDRLEVSIAPADGYGEYDRQLVQQVPRRSLKGIANVQVGMRLQAHTPQGPRAVTVTHLSGDMVTLDGNHPLAGQTLHFQVEVAAVRAATAEELAHGHVHGAGGHHH
jgi:FKBP-type peptidyl-prolyl cis-trans isomerase SlyD